MGELIEVQFGQPRLKKGINPIFAEAEPSLDRLSPDEIYATAVQREQALREFSPLSLEDPAQLLEYTLALNAVLRVSERLSPERRGEAAIEAANRSYEQDAR